MGAGLLEHAAPEIAEVVSVRKNFKTAAKIVGRQTLRKQLGEESRRRKGAVGGKELAYVRQGGSKQRGILPIKSTKQSSRSGRDIFTNISR